MLWSRQFQLESNNVQSASDADRLYIGLSAFQNGETIALNATDGSVAWRRTFDGPGWIGNYMRSLTLSPEGDLLVAFEAEYGPPGSIFSASAVVAVDPATGEERWRFVDGDATTDLGIGGLTIWENLVLYMAAQEVVAFDRFTREVVWRAPWTPGYLGTLTAPAVVDGVAYYADGRGASFAVDARTGERRWSTTLRGGAKHFAVCGPYFLMDNGPVEILERATGRHRGRLLGDDENASQMAVSDGVVYVGSERGVYAFDCNG